MMCLVQEREREGAGGGGRISVANKLGLSSTMLAIDLAVYSNAQAIGWENRATVLLMRQLGQFVHTAMACFGRG